MHYSPSTCKQISHATSNKFAYIIALRPQTAVSTILIRHDNFIASAQKAINQSIKVKPRARAHDGEGLHRIFTNTRARERAKSTGARGNSGQKLPRHIQQFEKLLLPWRRIRWAIGPTKLEYRGLRWSENSFASFRLFRQAADLLFSRFISRRWAIFQQTEGFFSLFISKPRGSIFSSHTFCLAALLLPPFSHFYVCAVLHTWLL